MLTFVSAFLTSIGSNTNKTFKTVTCYPLTRTFIYLKCDLLSKLTVTVGCYRREMTVRQRKKKMVLGADRKGKSQLFSVILRTTSKAPG